MIAVCIAVALCQYGISLAVRHGRRPSWLLVSPRTAVVGTGVAILIALPIAVAAGAPKEVKDRWDNFKNRSGGAPTTASRPSQILNTSGSGRYQFWTSAVDAYKTESFHGIGPGTFEFWWAQHASYAGAFVRDAHSLYIETLAELGIVGFIIVASLVLAILGIGTVRALRAPPDLRLGLAAATAAGSPSRSQRDRLHVGDRRDADRLLPARRGRRGRSARTRAGGEDERGTEAPGDRLVGGRSLPPPSPCW